MLKFLRKRVGGTGSDVEPVDKENAQRNASIGKLLSDFPWLWSMKNHFTGHDSKSIKVSQDMGALNIVLSQPSHSTNYVVWAVTDDNYEIFNMYSQLLKRSESDNWAIAAIKQIDTFHNIQFLVLLDSISGRITIFRHPEKIRLNEQTAFLSSIVA